LGVLNGLLAQANLLHEKFSPGADHIVSLLGLLLSVFHGQFLRSFYGKCGLRQFVPKIAASILKPG
jgi:hypothetical protein